MREGEAVRKNIRDIIEILADRNTIDSFKGVYSKKGDVSGIIIATIKHLKTLMGKI